MGQTKTEAIINVLEGFLLGKRRQLEYALTCLLARGHLLIEDVPGVGKTTLAKSLAFCFHAEFKRIQFTSDMLPSDLIGVTVFHQNKGNFEFQRGPVFTNILLADEINRANPKTQSALLEAMHDAQVSHDGKTMALPAPFFVVATQNTKDQFGTFPLPESQLDRFLMRIHLGYPDENYEKQVIRGDYRQDFDKVSRFPMEDLTYLQEKCRKVHVMDEILDYIYSILVASRNHPAIQVGVSPRGGKALFQAAQSLAMIRGRDFVTPDDVVELAKPVFGHRIILRHNQVPGVSSVQESIDEIFREILAETPQPV